ncbi:hypothetical protein FNH05_19710 [Amycolatopsis rhizosphaerae]|uniref:DUF3159 domain-containing protein n=1 Tax=Amycolatopsis rhizosphaerae TaxID=2053003 RepID=A0A558CE08_9PSEU|nr:hypothetical protein [Amycolatopsis rhizosphaerae]TVT46892.1 hypothetical protein FNH05_19710 [Amycolatopsis rhizosphaerae]
MTYLRGFAPWIAFSVTSPIGRQWAALIALVICVSSLVLNRRAGMRLDGQVLNIGMTAYFAALTALAFAAPHSPLGNYDSPLSTAWLGLIALISLAIGQPFTLGIARLKVAPEVAGSPQFRHTNVVISAIWAVSFVFIAAAGFACVALHGGIALRVAYQIIGFGLPALFTHRYTKRIRARRTHGGQVPEPAPPAHLG